MDGKLSTGQSGGEGEAATCALAKNRYVPKPVICVLIVQFQTN